MSILREHKSYALCRGRCAAYARADMRTVLVQGRVGLTVTKKTGEIRDPAGKHPNVQGLGGR